MTSGSRRFVPPERTSPAGTWNAERVIEALKDWTREFGQPPRVYEWSVSGARAAGRERGLVRRWAAEHPRWPSSHTVWRYFGSWSAALQAAGLVEETIGPWELSLSERVQSAQRMAARGVPRADIAAELGVRPATVTAYLNASPCPRCAAPVVSARAKHCVACAAALSHLPAFTPQEILDALRDWADEQGSPPKANDWMATDDEARSWAREYPRWPSVGQAVEAHGSWNGALQAAGLAVVAPPTGAAIAASRRAGAESPRGWTPDAILETVAAWAVRHGRAPQTHDLRSPLPSAGVVVKHFGSQAALRKALGLPASTHEWSQERIVAAMRSFAAEHGRPPTAADWKSAAPTYPAPETVGRHFGSWGAGLRAAGLAVARSEWTRETALEAITAHVGEHGRAPKATEWQRRDPSERRPASHNLTALFGSFDDALRAAGLQVESWDRDQVVAALRQMATELGRPPRLADLRPKRPGRPGADRVLSLYGTFTAARDAAGLQRPVDWTAAAVVDAIRVWTDTHGRPPRYVDWARGRDHHPAASVLERRFGSFTAALVAAGVTEPTPDWDRESVLAALRGWTREHGRPPTAGQWRGADPDDARPEYQRVARLFGTWDAALQQAGLHFRPTRWSDQLILDAIRTFAAQHGRAPRTTDWQTSSDTHPSAATVANHFGSWSTGLAAAGFGAARRQRWEPDEILAAMRAWATEHGRAPTRADWRRRDPHGRHPGASTVHQQLGAWDDALKRAGLG